MAFDWMGRQIITMRPGEGAESNLFLADLGVGEVMALPFEACVEYQTPLYLGGEQSIENLVVIDLDVSWTIGGPILQQTRTLKPGEKVHLEH